VVCVICQRLDLKSFTDNCLLSVCLLTFTTVIKINACKFPPTGIFTRTSTAFLWCVQQVWGTSSAGPGFPHRRKSKFRWLKGPLLLAIFQLVQQVWVTSSVGPGFPHRRKSKFRWLKGPLLLAISNLFSKFGEHLPRFLDSLTAGKVSLGGSRALYYWPSSNLFSKFG
jgi:hypothetical protein